MDFRSDTVTKPNAAMYEAMQRAEVGDDVFEEDPTVKELQAEIAKYFGKEDALFFPSGTMSNLTAILAWCPHRGSEIIAGDQSHIFLFEQAGAAQFGGVSFRTIRNEENGTMKIKDVEKAIRDDDIHEPRTGLITVENTHNACGGKILQIPFLNEIREVALKHNLPVHMDGARIWNALQESYYSAKEMSSFVDSISVCLSKGLGAPIGSLLVGPKNLIQRAKRIRKALGGGMRQSGILAAAGLVAFQEFLAGSLKRDHTLMQQLVDECKEMSLYSILGREVHTNILFLRLTTLQNSNAFEIVNFLKTHNLYISAWEEDLLRIVVHRNISEEGIHTLTDWLKTISHVHGDLTKLR